MAKVGRAFVICCIVVVSSLASGCQLWNEVFGSSNQAASGSATDAGGAACTKDSDQIRSVMLSPPECNTAKPCPCGTFCSDDLGGHCTADCIDDSWCAPDHACSDFGQCLASSSASDGGASINPTCPRNEALLDQIGATPRACSFDDECPFGSYCDRAKSACAIDCRQDSDCAAQGATFVCDCLGKCVEAQAVRPSPASDLPSMELDHKVFRLSRPADITQPQWGDANQREVNVTLRSAIAQTDASGAVLGPKVTIRVTPDANTLVQCPGGSTLAAQACTFVVPENSYQALLTKDGYASQPFAVEIAPAPGAASVTSWRVTFSSDDVSGPPLQALIRYDGPAQPAVEVIGPDALAADFHALGTATVTTVTGHTIAVPVEARVFDDPNSARMLVLYDPSHLLSPTGKVPLSSAYDYPWIDSDADAELGTSISGHLAFYPSPNSMTRTSTGAVSGAATLFTLLHTGYQSAGSLSFSVTPTTDPLPHGCDSTCTDGSSCTWGFCGGELTPIVIFGQPVEVHSKSRDQWTVNRDLNLSDDGFKSVAFTFPGFNSREGFLEPDRNNSTVGKAGDFDAWFFDFTTGQGTFFSAQLRAVPLLRATEDVPWQTTGGLLETCLSELARTPTNPTIPANPTSDWRDDPAFLRTTPQCADLGRFYLALRDRDLYQRLIQQWLQLHSFVARQGVEEGKLAEVANLIEEPGAANAATLDQLMTTMEGGLGLVLSELSTTGLDAEKNALLAKLTPDELRQPDYRATHLDGIGPSFCHPQFRPCPPEFVCETEPSGSTACAPRSMDETPQFDQPAGIPPFLLETAANYVRLTEAFLFDRARRVYGSDGHLQERANALIRYGTSVRLALTIEDVAQFLHNTAEPCSGVNCEALERRWQAAVAEYQGALTRVARAADALRGDFDLYGVPADEVALFFGDPVGTNSRYFASSDYLLAGYAEPAVASARAALDTARDAWVAQRNALVQDQVNDRNHQNEVDAIKSKFGSVILENCGQIQVSGQNRLLESTEVLDYFKDHAFDNQRCFVSPSCAITTDTNLDEFSSALFDAFKDKTGNVTQAATLVARSQVCKVASISARVPSIFGLGALTQFSNKVATLCPGNNLDSGAGWNCQAWLDDDGQFYFGRRDETNARMPIAAFYRPISRSELGASGTFRLITSGVLSTGLDLTNGPDANVYDFIDYARFPFLSSVLDVATQQCSNGAQGHPSVDAPLPSPVRNLAPDCFHGAMGTAYFQFQSAQSSFERAKLVLTKHKGDLVDQFNECALIDAHKDAILTQLDLVQNLEDDIEGITAIPDLIQSVFTLNGGEFLDGVQALFGGDTRADERRFLEQLEKKFSLDESSTRCWNQWRSLLRELDTATADIQTAALTMKSQIVAMNNMTDANRLALQEGLSALERDANRPVGSLAHTYWLDEKVERFKKQLEWARRLTLLSLNAVEYEFQQSLPYRTDIATAVHPDQLENVVLALKAEQASRTINRRRPEESATVISLRDDVLSIRDRSDAAAGERNWKPAQRFASRLWDERYAVRTKGGEWLGQGIPFTLGPMGALETRCGERMWRVTATIQGDGLGTDAPNASVILLKRNTFASQFCEGKGDGMQSGTIRPSAELFQPGSQIDLSESDQMTGALLTPWFNVRRSDFYKQSFQDGSSEELAGRGMYGDYVFLFPKQVLEAGFPLERVEDVLLRIDYLSVDNLPN